MAKGSVKGRAAGLLAAAAFLGGAAGGGLADRDDLDLLVHAAAVAEGTGIACGGDGAVVLFSSPFSYIPPEEAITAEDLLAKPFLANNVDLFRWEPAPETVSQFTATANIENEAGDALARATYNDQAAVESRTFRVFSADSPRPVNLTRYAVAFRSNADQAFPGPSVSADEIDPRVAALDGGTVYVWDSEQETFFSVFEYLLTPQDLSLEAPSVAMVTGRVRAHVPFRGVVTTGAEIRDVLVAFSGNGDPESDNADGNSEIFLWSRRAFLDAAAPAGGVAYNGGILQVTHTSEGDCWGATVNRDGEVAFLSTADITGINPDGSVELFLWKGNRFRQLTNITTGTIGAPRWSANGRTLVFEAAADLVRANPDESSEIFSWDGRSIRQLTRGTTGASTSPSVDPSGRLVAFTTTADLDGLAYGSTAPEVVVCNRGGKSMRQVTLTEDGGENESPLLTTDERGTVLTWVSASNFDGRNSSGLRRIWRTKVAAGQ
ncbi:MAG: PD40 domain-containing protein [Planctomycetaceae bacterium]|nr:hypothetical protein [Planctomycetota bacterium]NUN51721.1 PD40 domain-containing protein [Planctomycetaceae bacterium]